MDDKVIWITVAQDKQYQKLRAVIVALVKRYGWDEQLKFDSSLDPATHPEIQAALLAEQIEQENKNDQI